MPTEKTDAIVIRQADFSESSRVVTFFTRDWGKVSTVAKGGRRLKGPFEGALDLLTVCRIVFIRKSSSSLDLLTEAQLVSRFRPGRRELIRLYGGYYVAELLNSLTEDYDPHPVLFEEAVATVGRLSDDSNSEVGIRPAVSLLRFELVMLREMGQLPAMDVCINCGGALTGRAPFLFRVTQGGFVCRRCEERAGGKPYPGDERRRLQPGTVALLRQLSGSSPAVMRRLEIAPQQMGEVRQVVSSAVSHVLGRRPKMLRYLQR